MTSEISSRISAANHLLHAASRVLRRKPFEPRIRKARKALVRAPAEQPVENLAYLVHRAPNFGDAERICLFVTFSDFGFVWPHVANYCRQVRSAGYFVFLLVASGRGDLRFVDPGPDVADAVLVRENHGYDFSAWAHALRLYPELWNTSFLLLANDSVYGPFGDISGILRRAEECDADLVGLTECNAINYHLQSYFLLLKRPALSSDHVKQFWDQVQSLDDKFKVILQYELNFSKYLQDGGLTIRPLFKLEDRPPEDAVTTALFWKELILIGFPFLKVELLRDNISKVDMSGWAKVVSGRGYDIEDIFFHLGAVKPDAPGLFVS